MHVPWSAPTAVTTSVGIVGILLLIVNMAYGVRRLRRRKLGIDLRPDELAVWVASSVGYVITCVVAQWWPNAILGVLIVACNSWCAMRAKHPSQWE